jgi:hypothetical protein
MTLTILGNIAYLLMLVAFVTRDILHLRSLLVVAQALIVVYTWQSGVSVIAGWNVLYVAINLLMVGQILRDRRAVTLPRELAPLYARHFAALSPVEFLRWWRSGRRATLENARLASAGERPEFLSFVLSGNVRVSRDDDFVLDLPAGCFIGEMSLLTDRPANANVDTVGTADVMRWNTADLAVLRERQPALWTKIQSAIGLDLVAKVRRGEVTEPARSGPER